MTGHQEETEDLSAATYWIDVSSGRSYPINESHPMYIIPNASAPAPFETPNTAHSHTSRIQNST